mgnify:CR=1 FL=1
MPEETSPPSFTPDHRAAQRRTPPKSGKIVFNGSKSTHGCTVRNLSSQGAKLQVASVVGIPDNFDLMLAGSSSRRPCHVIWRRLKEVGIAFDSAH